MADDSSELDEIVQVASKPSSAPTTSVAGHSAAAVGAASVQEAPSGSADGKMTPTTAAPGNQSGFEDSNTNGFTTAPASSDEDFDSDDDDDSRSNSSNKNTGNRISLTYLSRGSYGRHANKGELKRSHHNVLERKRRDLLKDSFSMLRNSVPLMQPKERVSRAEILKQAADYIQSTVKRNACVREELDELIKRNKEFDERQKKKMMSCENEVKVEPSFSGDGAQQLLNVSARPKELTIKQEL